MSQPLLAIVVGATLASATGAAAQEWPTRPVTMVVPFAPGGPIDTIARVLAPRLSELLGQQVIIENVGGAGGMTGTSRVAKASADGYQFALGNLGTHAVNQTLYKRPLYNAATDFVPVALIALSPLTLLARKDFPADNLSEFITHVREYRINMQYGSGGTGSASHLACELINAAIGVKVTHVPYRGAALAMQDLIAGRLDYQCPDVPIAIPQIEGKAIKAIAILTRGRSSKLPGVASAHEQGLINFDAANWFAVFLPKDTPATIVQKLHAATVASMDISAVQMRMQEIGADLVAPEQRTTQYLQRFVQDEIMKWAGPIKAAGISAD